MLESPSDQYKKTWGPLDHVIVGRESLMIHYKVSHERKHELNVIH